MNKTAFAKILASRLTISEKDAQKFMNVFVETLGDVIMEDESILFQGFGTFSLWPQTERVGRNPKTGTSVTIRARNSLKFKPGSCLLAKLNKK